MEVAFVIEISALHKHSGIGEVPGVNHSVDVCQLDASADVPSSRFDGTVPVDVAQLAQTKAIGIVLWIGESIDSHFVVEALVGLTHSDIQFKVRNGCPVVGLDVRYRSDIGWSSHFGNR